jgi:hypothetical protein
VLDCSTPHRNERASALVTLVPVRTSTPWLEAKYGIENSATFCRAGVMLIVDRARSKPLTSPATSPSQPTLMTLSFRCRALAMYCAMPYSKPPVIVDGLFPSQNPGPGRFVATVSTPGVDGRNPRRAFATGAEFCEVVVP